MSQRETDKDQVSTETETTEKDCCIEDLVRKTLHLFGYDRYRYTAAEGETYIYIYIAHRKREI